jgi:hypothetical protein
LKAAGIQHRRIYDVRHTFATWSVGAGMSIPYGRLVQDPENRGPLDAYDAQNGAGGHDVGTNPVDLAECDRPDYERPAAAGLLKSG